ncbi:MAG: recombinase family protein [Leptolyngbyaceae cyanobacterium SL_7_1]|nr:recombinase family protein [Leptolyngbyaceae cyanobacterium SL_7_1]
MKIIAYLYRDTQANQAKLPAWGRSLDRLYEDWGDRPQLEQLLQDCQHDPPDYLLVQQLEDLGDSAQIVSDRLHQLEQLGVSLITTTATAEMGTTEQMLHLLEHLHTLQTQQRSRRIRQGHARNRIKALPPPGKAPYGYLRSKDRYTLDRTTAPVVKDFFEHFLLYGSLRGSVRYLHKKYNKKISASTGKRWLTSPVYRGNLAYHDGAVVANTHVPLLSREEAAQVDRLLRRNHPLAPRTASAPRSLAGLVQCECQSSMTITRVTARSTAQEYLYLRPVACPRQPKCRGLAYAQVLEQTIQRICVDLPRAVATTSMPDVDGMKQVLSAEILAKQAILSQLPDLLRTGVLDDETATLRSYTLRTDIAALEATLAQLPPVNLQAIAQTVSLPQFWLDLSEAERRFYFREFIRQIQIVRDGVDWELRLVFVF